MAGGVFVSYRRDDAAHVGGRLADALAARFGRARIFIDVDSVAPGEDFVRKIEDTIRRSGVFLAVIGPNWLCARTAGGARRVDQPGDFIRLEVVSALKAGVRIIPVLVDGASMPRAEELPEEMAQLVRHNAMQLNHTTFQRDLAALVAEVGGGGWRRLASPPVLAGAAGAVALLALGVGLWPRGEAKAAAAAAPLTTSVSLKPVEDGSGKREMMVVSYLAERDGAGRLTIRADLPYRERLERERRIDGLEVRGAAINARMPTLLVQATNTTDKPIAITELRFEVVRAEPDMRPLPVVREIPLDYHLVRMANEGWGPPESPRFAITSWGLPETDAARIIRTSPSGLASWEPCAAPTRLTDAGQLVVDGVVDGDETTVFDLAGKMPRGYGDAPYICAVGELSYGHAGQVERVQLRTRVSNRLAPAAAGLLVGTYDLWLDPDREGYVAVVPAVHEIAPGATLALDVTIRTDRSSQFTLRQSVQTAAGAAVAGEEFGLEVFVARHSAWGWRLAETSRKEVPMLALQLADPDGWAMGASYDPQGKAEARFELAAETSEADCEDFLSEIAPAILDRAGLPRSDMTATDAAGREVCSRRLGLSGR